MENELEYCSCPRNCQFHQPMTAGHKDEGKPGLQYILVFKGLAYVAKVGDFGAKKYGQWNYRKGMDWMRLLGSCGRHLASFIIGEDCDSESGLPHIAHFIYDGLILLEYWIDGVGHDDRYKNSQNNIDSTGLSK